VIPRVVAEGRPIYDGKLPLDEAQRRIDRFYLPYHEKLNELMRLARDRYGSGILFDCHSMPGEALRGAPRVRGRRPEIVLGDRFGAAAARELVDQTHAAFETAGFTVARNTPFAGGYITQRYGRPGISWHAIQIEIDRGLYLDEGRVRPSSRFEETRARLVPVIDTLARLVPPAEAVAAE
jgi:N-formylglutamate deformylase